MGIGREPVEFPVGPIPYGDKPGTVPAQIHDSLRILRPCGHKKRPERRSPPKTAPFASHPQLMVGEGSAQECEILAAGEPESSAGILDVFISRQDPLKMVCV